LQSADLIEPEPETEGGQARYATRAIAAKEQ
jgi:hypothetical protein